MEWKYTGLVLFIYTIPGIALLSAVNEINHQDTDDVREFWARQWISRNALLVIFICLVFSPFIYYRVYKDTHR